MADIYQGIGIVGEIFAVELITVVVPVDEQPDAAELPPSPLHRCRGDLQAVPAEALDSQRWL